MLWKKYSYFDQINFSQDLLIKRNKNTYQSFYKLIFLARCVFINNYVFQGGSLQDHLSCLH